MIGWPSLTAVAADGPGIAAGRTATASSADSEYTARNVTDGNQSTYWEGPARHCRNGSGPTSARVPGSTR